MQVSRRWKNVAIAWICERLTDRVELVTATNAENIFFETRDAADPRICFHRNYLAGAER